MEMRYGIRSEGIVDQLKGRLVDRESLDAILGLAPPAHTFVIAALLPINLKGTVLRNLGPEGEVVRITDGKKIVDLRRDGFGHPGDIGVQCSSRGDEAEVRVFLVASESIDVCVYPGEPAIIQFRIESELLKTLEPGMVAKIAAEAEKLAEKKLLVHFQESSQ